MNAITEHDPETGELVEHARTPLAIVQARLAVMRAAKGVGKTGRNTFHGYDYASDEDVLGLLQPLMAEHGLLLEMRPTSVEFDENKNAKVTFDMTWIHESGVEGPPIPWYGIASDCDKQGRLQDKWFNKAATAAEKYFLLKQFHIPAGKNSDPDAADDKSGPANAKPKPRQRTPDIEEIDRQREEMDAEYRAATAPEPEKPHLIKLPVFADPYKAWGNWCRMFVGKLNAAKTLTEFNAWVMNNEEMRGALADFCEGREDDAKGWHEQLKKDAQAISTKFGPGEP